MKKKWGVTSALVIFTSAFLIVGCSSKKGMDSSAAQSELEKKLEGRVGKANKQDLIQQFGPANWCREEGDGEKCRFYKKLDTEWMGSSKDRAHRETYDEVIAVFDSKGKLQSFEANAQR